MKKLFAAACIGLVLTACNQVPENPNVEAEEANNELTDLKSEVMEVHDSAMIKMQKAGSQMSKLKNRWQTAEDSLPYQQAFRELKEANDDMMDWMHSFNIPEEASDDEIREYLLQEKKAIQAVHAEMKKAISEAAFLLENSEAEWAKQDTAQGETHQH